MAEAHARLLNQERALVLERERMQPYFGAGLQLQSSASLESLQEFHKKRLQELQAIMVWHQT